MTERAHVDPMRSGGERGGPIIDLTDPLTLQRTVAMSVLAISKPLLNDTEVSVSEAVRFTTNELVVRLEKFLLVNPLGKLVVEYPATPWEHFRAVHFPKLGLGRWFLRRKPVRMHYEVRSAAASFPNAAMVFPTSLGQAVFVTREAPFPGEREENPSPEGPAYQVDDPEHDLPAYN